MTGAPSPPTGTQGAADGDSAPELRGGALQSAQLPGAGAVPLGDKLPGGVRGPED